MIPHLFIEEFMRKQSLELLLLVEAKKHRLVLSRTPTTKNIRLSMQYATSATRLHNAPSNIAILRHPDCLATSFWLQGLFGKIMRAVSENAQTGF
jgi:hypothetical protein